MERLNRLRQCDGVESDGTGSEHRGSNYRGRAGDLSRKITVDVKGEILELKETINTMVDQLIGFASEVTRVAREVGSEGKLGGQAQARRRGHLEGSHRFGEFDGIKPDRASAKHRGCHYRRRKRGPPRKITVDVKGEIFELKETINTMVDQLIGFASEVTACCSRGWFRGQAWRPSIVPGVDGTWKDLTDSVNAMASNLTGQVRNIAAVTTAVARGDLSERSRWMLRGRF